MIRRVIQIDEKKCNGCGACAAACHEGAIGMVNGKAKLLRDDYCDGLGDCLPTCPAGAITFIEREAAEYDKEAVAAHMAARKQAAGAAAAAGQNQMPGAGAGKPFGGCPGSMARLLHRDGAAQNAAAGAEKPAGGCPGSMAKWLQRDKMQGGTGTFAAQAGLEAGQPQRYGAGIMGDGAASIPVQAFYGIEPQSQLQQWPVQIKLVPVKAAYFNGAKLLIAADCTAYAYAGFHERFIRGHITLVGCPKLDDVDYAEKLTEIIRENDIKSVTIVRMEVPCCGGLENAAKRALQNSGKFIPWQVVTISTDGRILD